MILAHGFDAWLLPEAKTGPAYEVIRLLSGIPARLFLFLVGVSAAIQFEAQMARGLDTSAMRTRLLRRGLHMLVLAYVFRLQEWILSNFWGGWQALVRIDILNAIAASMIVLALVATPRRGRRQIATALAAAAVFLGLGPIVGPAHFPTWLPAPLTSYLGGQRPMAWFPLFPWAAWSLTGVAVGHLWSHAAHQQGGPRRILLLSGGVGLTLTVAVLLVRALAPNLIHYPSAVVFQMGPGVFFHRLGLIGALAAVAHLWCGVIGNRFSVMRQMGRTSLLIYWIHIELCYGNLAAPLKGKLHIPAAGLGVLVVTGLMLGVSVIKTRYGQHILTAARRLLPASNSRRPVVADRLSSD
jgi:uncharacterized membrane protein